MRRGRSAKRLWFVVVLAGVAVVAGVDWWMRGAAFRAAAADVPGVVACEGRRVLVREDLSAQQLQTVSDTLVAESRRRARLVTAPHFEVAYANFVIDPSASLSWTPQRGPAGNPPAAYAALLRGVRGTRSGTVYGVGSTPYVAQVDVEDSVDPDQWGADAAARAEGVPVGDPDVSGDVPAVVELRQGSSPPVLINLSDGGRRMR
ncbi:hypothetical protein [Raineyella sp. LH-20]|uniref:hypothetical protein n=1 Tax=Raineyella sp. LH-20 TaxID=3081204 RepID=UPI0029555395|nr:hypothetical protein [Raineyella sp. LH-20]WOP19876.1 hypothetical protein R0146_06275 [Raineyella sp. LH-20]